MTFRIALTLAAGLMAAACVTTPPPSSLSQARTAYDHLAADPEVVKHAPVQVDEAKEAVERAESGWTLDADEVETNHLAYIADKRIAIARAVAQQALAEAEASQLQEASTPGLPDAEAGRTQEVLTEAEGTQLTEAPTPVLPDPGAETQQALTTEAETSQLQGPPTPVLPDAEAGTQEVLTEAEGTQLTEAPTPGLPDAEAGIQQALTEGEASQLQEAPTPGLPDPREAALEAHEREVAALKALNAEETSRGAVITLGDVLFELDGRDLKTDAIRALMQLAMFLHEYPEQTVAIEGHTDSVGPKGFNVTVSRRRAQSVQNVLVQGGVDPKRVSAEGYGEANPVASNDSKAGRHRNRRVEIVIQSPNSLAKARP